MCLFVCVHVSVFDLPKLGVVYAFAFNILLQMRCIYIGFHTYDEALMCTSRQVAC